MSNSIAQNDSSTAGDWNNFKDPNYYYWPDVPFVCPVPLAPRITYPVVFYPKSQPHRCPICEGKQTVADSLYGGVSNTDQVICKTCIGTGVIWG
jgi:hypothetical protein